jgi:ribosomal-protein-serine acetyltransferase
MTLSVSQKIQLQLLNQIHSKAIYDLVMKDSKHLNEWLPWVDRMKSVDFIEQFIKGSEERNKSGIEYAFAIEENHKVVGRIGVYKIDPQNKIGEIGYWIGHDHQGKGIAIQSCKALIEFCFNTLELNRIEIKCGKENIKSQRIPEQLNFTHEGVLRKAEWLHHEFIDLNLYSLLKYNYNFF